MFNRQVKKSLAEQGKTKEQLAAHLGIRPSTVCRRLAGVRCWPIDDAHATARFLNMSPDATYLDVAGI